VYGVWYGRRDGLSGVCFCGVVGGGCFGGSVGVSGG